jgi:protein-disulfide isomerase
MRMENKMVKTASWAVAIGAVVALSLGGCSNPQEMGDLKAKVEEVQAQQKDILTKLDNLSKGQKQILAKAPAAAAPKRPTEDPNKVYDIPVGKSFTKGPEDAAVTIVEFSDFQ